MQDMDNQKQTERGSNVKKETSLKNIFFDSSVNSLAKGLFNRVTLAQKQDLTKTLDILNEDQDLNETCDFTELPKLRHRNVALSLKKGERKTAHEEIIVISNVSQEKADNTTAYSEEMEQTDSFLLKKCQICDRLMQKKLFDEHLKLCFAARFSKDSGTHKTFDGCAKAEKESLKCDICGKNLSHLTVQRRNQHLNSCIDKDCIKSVYSEDTKQQLIHARNALLCCPMCGQQFKSVRSQRTHLKKCAQNSQLNVEQMKALKKQQEEEYHAQLDDGLLPEDFIKLDEDTQLALALSSSLTEQYQEQEIALSTENTANRGNYQTVLTKNGTVAVNKEINKTVKKGKRGKETTAVSLLLSLPKSKAHERLSQRVDRYIFSANQPGPFPPTPPFKTAKKPNSSSTECWRKSSLDACVVAPRPLDFYVSELMPPISVSEVVVGSKIKRVSSIPGRRKSCDIIEQNLEDEDQEFETSGASSPPKCTQTAQILADLAMEEEVEGSVNVSSNVCVAEESQILTDGYSGKLSEQHGEIREPQRDLLSNAYLEMVNNPSYSDVFIRVQNGLLLPGHKVILAARCPPFIELISTDMESDIIDLSDFQKEPVICILKFIYSGQILLPSHCLMQVSKLASRFALQDLQDEVEKVLATRGSKSVLQESEMKMQGELSSEKDDESEINQIGQNTGEKIEDVVLVSECKKEDKHNIEEETKMINSEMNNENLSAVVGQKNVSEDTQAQEDETACSSKHSPKSKRKSRRVSQKELKTIFTKVIKGINDDKSDCVNSLTDEDSKRVQIKIEQDFKAFGDDSYYVPFFSDDKAVAADPDIVITSAHIRTPVFSPRRKTAHQTQKLRSPKEMKKSKSSGKRKTLHAPRECSSSVLYRSVNTVAEEEKLLQPTKTQRTEADVIHRDICGINSNRKDCKEGNLMIFSSNDVSLVKQKESYHLQTVSASKESQSSQVEEINVSKSKASHVLQFQEINVSENGESKSLESEEKEMAKTDPLEFELIEPLKEEYCSGDELFSDEEEVNATESLPQYGSNSGTEVNCGYSPYKYKLHKSVYLKGSTKENAYTVVNSSETNVDNTVNEQLLNPAASGGEEQKMFSSNALTVCVESPARNVIKSRSDHSILLDDLSFQHSTHSDKELSSLVNEIDDLISPNHKNLECSDRHLNKLLQEQHLSEPETTSTSDELDSNHLVKSNFRAEDGQLRSVESHRTMEYILSPSKVADVSGTEIKQSCLRSPEKVSHRLKNKVQNMDVVKLSLAETSGTEEVLEGRSRDLSYHHSPMSKQAISCNPLESPSPRKACRGLAKKKGNASQVEAATNRKDAKRSEKSPEVCDTEEFSVHSSPFSSKTIDCSVSDIPSTSIVCRGHAKRILNLGPTTTGNKTPRSEMFDPNAVNISRCILSSPILDKTGIQSSPPMACETITHGALDSPSPRKARRGLARKKMDSSSSKAAPNGKEAEESKTAQASPEARQIFSDLMSSMKACTPDSQCPRVSWSCSPVIATVDKNNDVLENSSSYKSAREKKSKRNNTSWVAESPLVSEAINKKSISFKPGTQDEFVSKKSPERTPERTDKTAVTVVTENNKTSPSSKIKDLLLDRMPPSSSKESKHPAFMPFQHQEQSPLPLWQRLGLAQPLGAKPGHSAGTGGTEPAGEKEQKFDDASSIENCFDDSFVFPDELDVATAPDLHTPVRQIVSNTKQKKRKEWQEPSPFTPMPAYDNMNTPQLKEAMAKIGVRPLGKKRNKEFLKHVYQETHQYETDSDYECTPVKRKCDEPSAINKKGSLLLNKEKSQFYHSCHSDMKQLGAPTLAKPAAEIYSEESNNGGSVDVVDTEVSQEDDVFTLSQESSHSDGPDLPEESILQGWPEEEEELICTDLTQTSKVALSEKLAQFITDNKDIYEKILLYEPLELDVLKKKMAEAGIRVGLPKVMDFLDEKCITFTMKNMCTRNNRHQRKPPAKKGGSPGKGSRKRKEVKSSQTSLS